VHEYLEATASFDRSRLQDIWSSAPEGVFFNLNGHTYKGREHWTRLWQFYQPNVRSGYWTPFDLGGGVRRGHVPGQARDDRFISAFALAGTAE
jgi:hypothetical protein